MRQAVEQGTVDTEVARMLHLPHGSDAGKEECADTVLKEVKAVVTHPLYRKCLAAGVIKAFLSWAHFYSERAEPLVLTDRDRKLWPGEIRPPPAALLIPNEGLLFVVPQGQIFESYLWLLLFGSLITGSIAKSCWCHTPLKNTTPRLQVLSTSHWTFLSRMIGSRPPTDPPSSMPSVFSTVSVVILISLSWIMQLI